MARFAERVTFYFISINSNHYRPVMFTSMTRGGHPMALDDDRGSEEAVPPCLLPSQREPHLCSRCDQVTSLQTIIGKFGEQPAYQLFHCTSCKNTDWVKK
jgi:hypothetical protein